MIEAKDCLDAIGKPLLYTVTQNFLDAFELDSLQALPEIEIKETKTNYLNHKRGNNYGKTTKAIAQAGICSAEKRKSSFWLEK